MYWRVATLSEKCPIFFYSAEIRLYSAHTYHKKSRISCVLIRKLTNSNTIQKYRLRFAVVWTQNEMNSIESQRMKRSIDANYDWCAQSTFYYVTICELIFLKLRQTIMHTNQNEHVHMRHRAHISTYAIENAHINFPSSSSFFIFIENKNERTPKKFQKCWLTADTSSIAGSGITQKKLVSHASTHVSIYPGIYQCMVCRCTHKHVSDKNTILWIENQSSVW